MKNTEGVPRGRGLAAPESEYPMVLLCVSVCKHSNYRVAVEDVLPEEALAQDKVSGQLSRLNEFGVYPADSMGSLHPMPRCGIILHDLTRTGIAVEVQLPVDDAAVFSGADEVAALQPYQVILADMALGAQEAEEVVLSAE